jgi:UDP-N-acetylmuramyl pentapeptide phosphotransferase/UDP-N-acetylglucosamine-1-phosphate transferase
MFFFTSIFTIILSFSLIYLCNKNFFLLNQSGDKHQVFVGKISVPLVGGVIIFLLILVSNFDNLDLFFVYIFCIFIIGLLSDLKKLNSPVLRLMFQIFTILLAVYFSNIIIVNTRLNFLDSLLNNYYFAIIFTSFCILIIVNGTNFIDGINSLVIGYYIIICLSLLYLEQKGFNLFFNYPLQLIITSLLILYFFNLFNKLYLGDAGAYLLGFLFSIELINFYLQNITISPFFIILLLWYPAFENLFSILRKINLKRSPINPDTNHLHQLIYAYYVKRNFTQLSANNITSIAINAYNAFVVTISLLNPSHTMLQIFLIIVNLSVYTFLYKRLFKYK